MRPNPLYMPIRKLGEHIRYGAISPVELTELFLKRLETLGPELNAVVTVTRERALSLAKKAEKEIKAGQYKGPLHGIPYGVKDLLATKGIATTWGAAPFKNQIFNYDATVIKKLDRAGAILCAKLAMIELAGGMGYRQPSASFTGPPKNPWNPRTWAGGSSSGSGAAVSAGLVPFSIGSETWGSILSPANNCGVTGLRPTYGRVSRHGSMALCWTLDKLGPLCLTADDCGLVLEAIAGFNPNDLTTIDEDWKYKPKMKKRFRLAVPKGVVDGAEEDVRNCFEKALNILRKLSIIEEFEFPELPYEAMTRTILNAEAASAFDDFTESGEASKLTASEDRYGLYARTIVFAKDYLKALRLRRVVARVVDGAMEPFDAVVAPSSKRAATPIDQEFLKVAWWNRVKDPMGAIGNAAGLPSISVPCGFTNDGLPVGIQFMGRAYDENVIIAIATAFQSLTDWHTRHPNMQGILNSSSPLSQD